MSSKRETWGHTYVYKDKTISKNAVPEKELIFYCYIEENNEPHRYLRRGPEAEMYVRIDNTIDKSKLIEFLKNSPIDKGIVKGVVKLFKEGKLVPGSHEI